VVFTWRLTDGLASPNPPRSFDDAMFVLYDNTLDVSDDATARRTLERDLARLKGHLNGACGRETTLADLARIHDLCGNAAVELDAVWESYTKDGVKKGPFKRCFVVAGCGVM
jgi:hypothetical protein